VLQIKFIRSKKKGVIMKKRLSSVILLFIILFLIIIGCRIEIVEKPYSSPDKPTPSPSAINCITDIQLIASNSSKPPSVPGYGLIGYWDVDGGGARGTYGSTGAYMTGLYVK
jgi:hypothetical protein